MSQNTINATTTVTATTMSAKEFKQASYDAYLSYVKYIEGTLSAADAVTALSPLMAAYGFTLDINNIGSVLTLRMTSYGKLKGEVGRNVKSIATFRAFVKGGWQDVTNAVVHSNAGKNPADAKPANKRKTTTKADLEAQNAALLEKLETALAMLAERNA